MFVCLCGSSTLCDLHGAGLSGMSAFPERSSGQPVPVGRSVVFWNRQHHILAEFLQVALHLHIVGLRSKYGHSTHTKRPARKHTHTSTHYCRIRPVRSLLQLHEADGHVVGQHQVAWAQTEQGSAGDRVHDLMHNYSVPATTWTGQGTYGFPFFCGFAYS